MSNRSISWAAALRELKADRAIRHPVREERLRTSTGLRGAPVLAMSAWRGHSGRRYVVVVQPLDTPDLVAESAAVVLVVSRDERGKASMSVLEPARPEIPGSSAGLPPVPGSARVSCMPTGWLKRRLSALRSRPTSADRWPEPRRGRRDDQPGVQQGCATGRVGPGGWTLRGDAHGRQPLSMGVAGRSVSLRPHCPGRADRGCLVGELPSALQALSRSQDSGGCERDRAGATAAGPARGRCRPAPPAVAGR